MSGTESASGGTWSAEVMIGVTSQVTHLLDGCNGVQIVLRHVHRLVVVIVIILFLCIVEAPAGDVVLQWSVV